MGKFTGYMCDVCGTAENGNDRPEHWMGLRLPVVVGINAGMNGVSETKDICSNKCLLKFARGRNGQTTVAGKKSEAIPGLREFIIERGHKPQVIGPKLRAHTLGRHAMNGVVDDCLICEFETRKTEG